MPHMLVCADVLVDCILNTLSDANGNRVALDLPATKEICYLVLDDKQMGDVKAGGRTGQVWIQGYFITTTSVQEDAFTKWMLENSKEWARVTFSDDQLDVDAILKWAYKAKSTLYQRDLDADLRSPSAPMPQKDIFKGTQKHGRNYFNKSKGKEESPEAFLAMALKMGIPGALKIKSGVKNEWTVRAVRDYAALIKQG